MVSLEKDVTLSCHESRTEKKLPVTTYYRIKYCGSFKEKLCCCVGEGINPQNLALSAEMI